MAACQAKHDPRAHRQPAVKEAIHPISLFLFFPLYFYSIRRRRYAPIGRRLPRRCACARPAILGAAAPVIRRRPSPTLRRQTGRQSAARPFCRCSRCTARPISFPYKGMAVFSYGGGSCSGSTACLPWGIRSRRGSAPRRKALLEAVGQDETFCRDGSAICPGFPVSAGESVAWDWLASTQTPAHRLASGW